MPTRPKADIIILSESTRNFLKKLHFPEIPPEAKYIAFTEDGDAQFIEELGSIGGFVMPTIVAISYYSSTPFEIIEE